MPVSPNLLLSDLAGLLLLFDLTADETILNNAIGGKRKKLKNDLNRIFEFFLSNSDK